MEPSYAVDKIISFIREHAPNGVVVGISGGVDSSVTATLCLKALGREKVLGVFMPSRETPMEDRKHVIEFIHWLGIEARVVDISDLVLELEKLCGNETTDRRVLGNLRPRLRMTILYYYANLMNRLVAGTGNKTELLLGYFTKYGDGACDILPIGDLYKTEVFEVAEFLGIPHSIVRKKPSARLWEGQTDEEEIGMTYEEIDKQLKSGNISRLLQEMMERAKHKLEMPHICKLHD
ncbi:MAG: NAD+ synthase [Candidatus Diapherotrites archaeon]|nr:NAD+ synthase [Candidatus Diapherotrites archaeon]